MSLVGSHEAFRVGGRRILEISERHGHAVLAAAARRLGIRADHERTDRDARLRHPLPHGLTDQRNRRSAEQHDTGLPVQPLFREPQRHERFTGAARHDRLAAILFTEGGKDGVDRLPLMRSRIVGHPLFGRKTIDEMRPIETGGRHFRRIYKTAEIARHLLFEISARTSRACHDEPIGEIMVVHKRGEKRVAYPFGEWLFGIVALALDRVPLAAGGRLREKVDADILVLPIDRTVWPSCSLL